MSKTAKAKSRQPSLHSRAARRATSPSLQGNVSQSLKDIQPPSRTKSTTHIFSGARDAGIKKSKKKQLKRGQLERQRKGVERADIVKEQLDTKLVKSLGKLKTIKGRRKDWEQINGEAEVSVEGGAVGGRSIFAVLEDKQDNDVAEKENLAEEESMQVELPVRTAAAVPLTEDTESSKPKTVEDDVVT